MADEPCEFIPKTLKEIIFYKVDRSVAIIAIALIGGFAIYIQTESSMQIAALCVGALATYIGNKAK